MVPMRPWARAWYCPLGVKGAMPSDDLTRARGKSSGFRRGFRAHFNLKLRAPARAAQNECKRRVLRHPCQECSISARQATRLGAVCHSESQ